MALLNFLSTRQKPFDLRRCLRFRFDLSNLKPHLAAILGLKASAEETVGCYMAYEVAIQYGLLGDKEKVLSWLTQRLHDGLDWSFAPNVGPDFDFARSEPRFQDLLRRANFPPWHVPFQQGAS